MFKKLKQKLTGAEEKKRLAGNILLLGVLQSTNYILPWLTVPHLVRVLGPEYFGLLAFATATIMYFMLITDYGFNLSATRQISIHRDEKNRVSEIFSSVMIIKTGLMIVSFGLMTLLVFSFEKFSKHWEIYFLTFGMVIGQVLFPIWLFQGMERMKYITYLNIGAKVFFTVSIFIFLKEPADYLLVPLLTSIGFIVAGIGSLYLVKKDLNVSFAWQTRETLKFQLEEGLHVFLSSMSISLYTISTTFILGLFTNNTAVGYFAVADKIVQAFKGLYAPISQAIYPLISKKIQEDKQAGLAFIHNTTFIVGACFFAISTILLIFSEQIIYFFLDAKYQDSVLPLQIMAFLPFLISISNMMAVQGLYNLGFYGLVSKFVFLVAVLHLIILPIGIHYQSFVGAAITMVFSELLMVIFSVYYFIRFKQKQR